MKLRLLCFVLLISLADSINAQVDLENGLVAHYPFDGDVNDVTDFANNGIHSGTVSVEGFDGTSGGAWEFDGATAYLQIPHSVQNDFMSADAFAISIWLKIPETQGSTSSFAQILMKWTTQGFVPYPYDLRLQTENSSTPGIVAARRYEPEAVGCNGESIAIASTNPLNDNGWHHVLYQKKASTNELQYYIDGTLQGTSQDTLLCEVSNSADLRFGRREGTFSFPFKGLLDEFRIYDRALDEEEILLLGTQPSNAEELNATIKIDVAPNPVVGGQINILTNEPIGEVQIVNMQGQIVQSGNGNASLNLIGLPKGLYIVQIAIHGQWIQKRIVVQ
ncbi:MAG: LamG-like jellyroll fold domain-containing protein [Bacteroidota bacterium]